MMKSFVKCLCVCLRTFVDMYVGTLLGSFYNIDLYVRLCLCNECPP